jgi:ABC-type transport system involved in cytochrome c biogenesis permease subunit
VRLLVLLAATGGLAGPAESAEPAGTDGPGAAASGPKRTPAGEPTASAALYDRWGKGKVTWLLFAAGSVVLLTASSAGGSAPRLARVGWGVMLAATGALAGEFAWRWLLKPDPWYIPPLANQYEAMSASALLAAAVSLALVGRRAGVYVRLAACLYATAVLLAGVMVPEAMGTAVTPTPGILAAPIMALHVAVIVMGHAFAAMAGLVSVIYGLLAVGQRLGGVDAERLGPVDSANVLLCRLAMWMITLGTALGAVWADVAWNRWWGWDRKETWALITILILLAALHARAGVKRRRRAAVTACGALLACAAMLFNWIVVNYFLPGLHSYA